MNCQNISLSIYVLFFGLIQGIYTELYSQTLIPDSNFGDNGYKYIQNYNVNLSVNKKHIVLDDQSIITIGRTTNKAGLMQKYLADGRLDTLWADKGKLYTDLRISDIIKWYNGKCLVVYGGKIRYFNPTIPAFEGHFNLNDTSNFHNFIRQNPVDSSVICFGSSAIYRYSKNGIFDSSFAKNGLLNIHSIAFSGAYVNDLTFTKDNKMIATGRTHISWNSRFTFIFKIKQNGTLDSSFNSNGVFIFLDSTYNTGGQVGLQSVELNDGSIAVALCKDSDYGNLSLLKLKKNGTLDSTFHTTQMRGYIEPSTLNVPCLTCTEEVYPLLYKNDSLYLIGNENWAYERIAITRISKNGVIDVNYKNASIASDTLGGDFRATYSSFNSSNDIIISGWTYGEQKINGIFYGHGINAGLTKAFINGRIDKNFVNHDGFRYTINDKSDEENSVFTRNSLGQVVRTGQSSHVRSYSISTGEANKSTYFTSNVLNSKTGDTISFYRSGTFLTNEWGSKKSIILETFSFDTSIYTLVANTVSLNNEPDKFILSIINQKNNGSLRLDSTGITARAIKEVRINLLKNVSILKPYMLSSGNFLVPVYTNDSINKRKELYVIKVRNSGIVDSAFGLNGYKKIAGIDAFDTTIFFADRPLIDFQNNQLYIGLQKMYGDTFGYLYNRNEIRAIDSNGNYVSNFGNNGIQILPQSTSLTDMLENSEGNALAVNQSKIAWSSRLSKYDTLTGNSNNYIRIHMFSLSGGIDTSFGSQGFIDLYSDTSIYKYGELYRMIFWNQNLFIGTQYYLKNYQSKRLYNLISPSGDIISEMNISDYEFYKNVIILNDTAWMLKDDWSKGIEITKYIIDYTQSNKPIISFDLAESTLGEAATGSLPIAVKLSRPNPNPIRVSIALSGTAISRIDYTISDTAITFPANSTAPQTILINAINDTEVEGQENIILTLTNPTDSATIGLKSVHTVNIQDDDSALITFENVNSTLNESNTQPLNIVVKLSNARPTPISVNISASGTAVSGTDYTLSTSTVTFPANSTTQTITIAPIDDNIVEGDETIVLSLSNPTSSALLGNQRIHSIVLKDNDSAPIDTPVIQFETNATNISEPDSSPNSISLTISKPSSTAITVPLLIGGSATLGADFILSQINVTFPPNSTSKITFYINAINDTEIEPTENIILTIGTPNGLAKIGTQNTHSISLADDDATNSINQIDENSIAAYPSPFDNFINLAKGKTHFSLICRIYNNLGQEVLNQNINSSEQEVSISTENLKNGLYIIEVIDIHNNTLLNQKIIKSSK